MMRLHLLKAYYEVSFSYLIGEISDLEYFRLLEIFNIIMSTEELIEALESTENILKELNERGNQE